VTKRITLGLVLLTAAAPLLMAQSAGVLPAERLLSSIRVGTPIRHEKLVIFPLIASPSGTRSYTMLDEAIRSGQVRVEEKDGGQVNAVRIRNAGKTYVFGIAGEIVSGARQDRMLQDDVLLPPGSGWLDVPVFCTEHGRWAGSSLEFGTKGQVVAGRVRERASKSQSQQEVWDEVDGARADLKVESPTRAFAKVYDDRGVQAKVEIYSAKFDRLPELAPGASGVLVALGREIVCVDVFGSPALFRKMWPKLLRSYVIDAISRSAHGTFTQASAAEFVRAAARAEVSDEPTVGSGTLHRLQTSRVTGSSLTFGREVVHLDLFPGEAGTRYDDGSAPAPQLQIRRSRTNR
jgi:hypothetical protein